MFRLSQGYPPFSGTTGQFGPLADNGTYPLCRIGFQIGFSFSKFVFGFDFVEVFLFGLKSMACSAMLRISG